MPYDSFLIDMCILDLGMFLYRRFIVGSIHVSRIIIYSGKLHSAINNNNSTWATFSTTLSDNFQKKSTFFLKKLFSVEPAMNLRNVTSHCRSLATSDVFTLHI